MKKPWLFRVYRRGDEILPSYVEISIKMRIPIKQPVFHEKYGRVFWFGFPIHCPQWALGASHILLGIRKTSTLWLWCVFFQAVQYINSTSTLFFNHDYVRTKNMDDLKSLSTSILIIYFTQPNPPFKFTSSIMYIIYNSYTNIRKNKNIYIYNLSNASLFPLPTSNFFLPKDLDPRRGAQQRCSCSSTHPAGVFLREKNSPRAPFPQGNKALLYGILQGILIEIRPLLGDD